MSERNEYIRAEVLRARTHRWGLPPAEERAHLPFLYALAALPPGAVTFVVVAPDSAGRTGILVFIEDPAQPRRVLWTQAGPWSNGEVERWIGVLRERYRVALDANVVRVAAPPAATEPPPHVIEVARARAAASPCGKSQRGAVVFDADTGAVYGHACNHLPGGIECADAIKRRDYPRGIVIATTLDEQTARAKAEACRSACGARCVHAETAAILRTAVAARATLTGLEIVHLKVVNGEAVASGGPSCVPCAAMILEAGLAACWLFHAVDRFQEHPGWRRYPAAEFYRLSCAAKGLPEG